MTTNAMNQDPMTHDVAPAVSAEHAEPKRARKPGCRASLAATLACMCLCQIVLSTGMWMRPHAWWLTTVLNWKYDWPSAMRARFEGGEVEFMFRADGDASGNLSAIAQAPTI